MPKNFDWGNGHPKKEPTPNPLQILVRDWHRKGIDWYCGCIWCTFMALAIAMDLWLVFNNHESISSRTWKACEDHPTIIAAGTLASVGVALLIRKYPWMVFFTGVMCGHLFIHY